jgi:hypothetical protein
MRDTANRRGHWLIMVCGLTGCSFSASAGPGPHGPPPGYGPPPPVEASAGSHSAEPTQHPSAHGHADAPGAYGSDVAANPDCPNPANHCLAEDVVLVASRGLDNRAYIYLEPSRQTGPANSAGEATFLTLRQGKDLTTRHAFRTRPAHDEDLAVGALAVMLHRKEGQIYRAPSTRKEAQSHTWWLARIVSVASVDQGFVVVSGGYKIAPNAVRVVEGDDSPRVTVSSEADAHFLSPDHWIVADRELGNRKYVYAQAAAPIQAPSPATKGEGHFILLDKGAITWSAHAYRSRPATKADMRVGMTVIAFHRKDGPVYAPPRERSEALTGRWWVAKVVDTSSLHRGTVDVAGGYTIRVDAIRVPMD